MIICKFTTEFGCVEAGQKFKGKNGTKLLQEGGLGMPKMLKDMFDQLFTNFDQVEYKIRKLETIAFLHVGMFSPKNQYRQLLFFTYSLCIFLLH